MALEPIVEDVEQLPESIREHYEQTDEGYYQLSVQPKQGFALENVENLKSALSKEREERKQKEKALKQFEDLDPEQARQALEELERYKSLDPEKEADKLAEEKAKSITEQMKQKHQEELQSWQEKANQYQNKLVETTIERSAQQALLEAKIKEDNVDLLMPHFKSQVRFNDNLEPEVVDSNGNPRIGDSNGNPMTVQQLAQEFRDKHPDLFKGSGKSGSGMNNQGVRGNGPPKNLKRSEMSMKEKADYAAEFGQDALLNLPK